MLLGMSLFVLYSQYNWYLYGFILLCFLFSVQFSTFDALYHSATFRSAATLSQQEVF